MELYFLFFHVQLNLYGLNVKPRNGEKKLNFNDKVDRDIFVSFLCIRFALLEMSTCYEFPPKYLIEIEKWKESTLNV